MVETSTGGEEMKDNQDWKEHEDDGETFFYLENCSLHLKSDTDNKWVFACEVNIKFERDFDTNDRLDTNLHWSDSLKPHQYNVIAWSSFNDNADFSGEP